MVLTNYIILPHPLLQIFVDHYILSTSEGKIITLYNTWPASNETSLVFYMANQPIHSSGAFLHSALQDRCGCIIGLQSGCKVIVSFKGVYYTFLIQFKANGFGKLFRLPAAEFVNKLYHLNEVFGNEAGRLNEALQNADGIQQMADLTDAFLLRFLVRQKRSENFHDGITFVANELFSNSRLLSIEQYAAKAAMSVRNFGRRFTEQTGVSPKFYCRLLRFNNAITEKLKHPQQNWTSVAYECGYYDQMHLIKDFKEFANASPSDFFGNEGGFTKPDARLGSDLPTQVNATLLNEKFVFVKRAAAQ